MPQFQCALQCVGNNLSIHLPYFEPVSRHALDTFLACVEYGLDIVCVCWVYLGHALVMIRTYSGHASGMFLTSFGNSLDMFENLSAIYVKSS